MLCSSLQNPIMSIKYPKFLCSLSNVPHPLSTGRCTIHNDATQQVPFIADHLLALTSENTVYANVQEPMRIVAASVPRDPSVSPQTLLMKSLSEVVGSDRNVSFKGGYSRRFLAAPDGYNISFHNTLIHANFNGHLHYPHHMEANFFIKGQGEYIWKNGQQQFDFEKHHGTMLLVEHDPHEVKIGTSGSIAICLFFPPLKGTERLRLDQESGSSY